MDWEFTLFLVVFGVIAHLLLYTAITGISPVPTTRAVRRDMLGQIPGEIRGTVFELGSGWGALAFALARRLPANRVIGMERSPIPWAYSRLRQLLFRQHNLDLRRGDFMRISCREAGLVVCYLFPRGMRALGAKFETELRHGTVVISNTFPIPGWTPVHTLHPESDPTGPPVYIYMVPESVSATTTTHGGQS